MKRRRRRNRHLRVGGVNLGDGEPVKCSVVISPSEVTVRRHRSRRFWTLPLSEAVGLIARRAQVREAERRDLEK